MLVNHLRAHGVDVAVVAPHTRETTFVPGKQQQLPQSTLTTPLESPEPPKAACQNVDIRIRGYPLPYNPELSIVYPVRLSTLYRRSFGAPPDLIYLASPASVGFQVMLQLRQQPRRRQVPIICNFQTDLAGYCAILFPPPFSHFAVAVFAHVQSFLFNHASVKTIFYPSRFVRRYLEAQHVQAAKLEVLQRGVDTTLFHPARQNPTLRRTLAPDGDEIVLLCVSRLAGEKGFSFLADAARALDARGLRFTLHIVGGNRNAAVEADIKAEFAPLAARGKVVFAGFRVGEALAAAYATADVFLHCSVTETFGLVVLEAMASGVPVVARDEGGPSDIVRDGVSGFLTPPDDLDAFVGRVVLLAGDAALRRRCAENARRQAEEATWERINNKVAWRMAETIEQRESDALARRKLQSDGEVRGQTVAEEETVPLTGTATSFSEWLFPTDVVQARVVDARLAGGMAAISAAWVAVGAYLVFIKVGLWVKATFRAWFSREAPGVRI